MLSHTGTAYAAMLLAVALMVSLAATSMISVDVLFGNEMFHFPNEMQPCWSTSCGTRPTQCSSNGRRCFCLGDLMYSLSHGLRPYSTGA